MHCCDCKIALPRSSLTLRGSKLLLSRLISCSSLAASRCKVSIKLRLHQLLISALNTAGAGHHCLSSVSNANMSSYAQLDCWQKDGIHLCLSSEADVLQLGAEGFCWQVAQTVLGPAASCTWLSRAPWAVACTVPGSMST